MSAVDDFIAAAASQVGTAEDPPGSNRTPYGDWYGTNGVEWCGQFVAWCAARAGVTELVPRFEWTPTGADWFQHRNQWGSVPHRGALVFYDFGMGRISHVGIVENVTAAGWQAIEGNSSGRVARRSRLSTGALGGFGYPAWPRAGTVGHIRYGGTVLRRGSAGGAVQTVQRGLNAWLITLHSPPIDVDGLYGPLTEAAVKHFQASHQLEVDGEVGRNTWPALVA